MCLDSWTNKNLKKNKKHNTCNLGFKKKKHTENQDIAITISYLCKSPFIGLGKSSQKLNLISK